MTHKYRVGEPNMQAMCKGEWKSCEINEHSGHHYVVFVPGFPSDWITGEWLATESKLRKRPTDTDLSEYSYSELIERLNQVSAEA